MTSIFKSYRPYFVILAVFVGMLMAVNHSGEFPLIDDWAYAHGVSDFLVDGVLKISDWVAMTQVAHLFAGVAWSMIFGYSLENLHEFTLLVSLIGAFVMYYGNGFFTRSVSLRLIGTFILVANPLWIYLSHTFMTDIPFTVLFLGLVVLIMEGKRGRGEWEEKHKHRKMRSLVPDIVSKANEMGEGEKERGREEVKEIGREVAKGGMVGKTQASEDAQSFDDWGTKHKFLQSTQSLDVHHRTKWSEHREHSERKGKEGLRDGLIFALILVLGVLIVLVRQTGLGIGLSFLLWVLLMDPQNRRRLLVPALVLAAVQILTLVGYEWVMSDAGALSTRYHGASSLSWILSRDWWVIRAGYYGLIQLQYLGMFLLPLLPFVILAVRKRSFPVGAWLVAGVVVLGVGVAVGGDILMNPRYTHLMQYDTVGHVMTIDFTYELLDFTRELYPVWIIIHILGLLNLGGCILLGWSPVLSAIRKFPKFRLGTHPVYWIILILVGYSLFISIGQFVFDRYLLLHIPLITWTIIAILDHIYRNNPEYFQSNWHLSTKIAGFLLVLSFLFGITGTNDSFEWNRVRFGAIHELVDSGIPPNQIDGGAEYNSWMKTAPLQPLRMHEKSWWYVDGDDYAIAFHEIPGYERLRPYEFSKYYGLKKDTIWVVRRKE